MVAARSQLVVEPGDVPVVGSGNRSAKTVADEILAVAERQVIRFRKSVQVIQYHRIRTNVQRVERRQVRRRQSREPGWRAEARSRDRPSRALRGNGALVEHDALPQGVARNNSLLGGLFGLP